MNALGHGRLLEESPRRSQDPSPLSLRDTVLGQRARLLGGALEPCTEEGYFPDLRVEGVLPLDLHGTLYRVGPNARYLPDGVYHPFFADGMAFAFHFADGTVSYRNRWVRTRRFLLEETAGSSLFDGMGNYVGEPPIDRLPPDDLLAAVSGHNTANTNVLPFAGRLLALSEAGLPYELVPGSLATVGTFDFDGSLGRSLTGHPKVDPVSGHLFGFSYGIAEPYVVLYEYDADGRLVARRDLRAPFPSMVHDFAVTERHIVVPIFPVTMRESRVSTTGSPFGWEPDLGTHIAVLSRDGDPEVRWFAAEPGYSFHVMNASDDGATIVVDLALYDAMPNFFNGRNTSRLARWTIDLATDELRDETLDVRHLEMPQVDARRVGRPYRHGYANGGFRGRMFHAIEHFDLHSGARRTLDLGDDLVAFEPVVAPRSLVASEADGYLLAIAASDREPRTDLLVLDAQQIDAGPVATVHLPHRVSGWFHGCWLPGPTGAQP